MALFKNKPLQIVRIVLKPLNFEFGAVRMDFQTTSLAFSRTRLIPFPMFHTPYKQTSLICSPDAPLASLATRPE